MKLIGNHLSLVFAATVFLLPAACNRQAPEKPNIILIIADDLSYNSVHAYGNDEVRTPNLDRLAREGTMFVHSYNMGSWTGAVCIASRTMLNTGKTVWRAEQADQKLAEMAAQNMLWSQIMKQSGYDTYFTGKWHVKIRPEEIFDYVTHVRPGMPQTVEQAYNRPIQGEEDKWSPYDKSIGGFWEGGKHWSEVLADDAVGFIQQAAQRDNPFFMYLAFNASHDPRQSPREYVESYPVEDIAVPENFQPLYPYAEQIGLWKEQRDESLAPFPRTEYAVRVHRQEYYAIITHMDDQIGRILEALEESGKAGNTYIFFTADHGLAVGYHGLMGKQNMYDHSMRPPMMVVGPDVPVNRKLEADVYLQDVVPTAIELSGAEVPEHVEFRSMVPLIRGEGTGRSHDGVYGCYRDLQRMIRQDGYKLIAYPYAGKLRLYNLERDPLEMNDLADEPDHTRLVGELFDKLVKMGQSLGDTLDIRSFFPDYQ